MFTSCRVIWYCFHRLPLFEFSISSFKLAIFWLVRRRQYLCQQVSRYDFVWHQWSRRCSTHRALLLLVYLISQQQWFEVEVKAENSPDSHLCFVLVILAFIGHNKIKARVYYTIESRGRVTPIALAADTSVVVAGRSGLIAGWCS